MSDLDRLFYWRGIAEGYQNYRGEQVTVPLENRINLLTAMGVDVSTPDAVEKEAYTLDVTPWTQWFGELTLAAASDNASFEINLQPEDTDTDLNWLISDADGNQVCSGVCRYDNLEETGEYLFEERKYSRRKVFVGALAPNYYTLSVKSATKKEETILAVYPPVVHQEHWSNVNEKIWGTIIQLYTLKSERNWGIGDFTDLCELIESLAKRGADVIGLNPLHALSTYLDDSFSPYSPSDRRFINPLYIDPTKVPEYSSLPKGTVNEALLSELRASDKVDYTQTRELKYPVFQQMFDNFISEEVTAQGARYLAFIEYVKTHQDSLLAFAYYEACNQNWGDARYVLRFNEQLEDLTKTLLDGHEYNGAQQALLFHCYLQWLAHLQLAECQDVANKAGMKVGLIRDLAVGADGGGAEVSLNDKLFCRNSSVGAPPDPFAQTGQNWGLPPVIPSEMRASGFKHFIGLLRSNMSSCGALRIDHAMSLMRLWWCPQGKTADYGAYVYYPFHEMLGLLALESHLNKCLIIGEDLGVVPDEFREALTRVKVFTNKVFYFERAFDSSFKKPEDYDAHSLAMVNNHDVPTLVSWWNRTDLELRGKLNLLEEGVSYADVCEERQRDKGRLLELLYDSNLYPESWHGRSVDEPIDNVLVSAILLLASRSASKIFVLQLEDLLMMDAPVNVPGTFKEHDNWQRKLSTTTAEIFADKRIESLLDEVNKQRKS